MPPLTSTPPRLNVFGGVGGLWDVGRRMAVARLTGHTEQVHALAYAPGGCTLVTASADHTITLWNTDPDQLASRVRRAPPWPQPL